MSISEFSEFSMNEWTEIQYFFMISFIFTNFKSFFYNSMIFHDLETEMNFNDFSRDVGNLI